MVMGVVISSKRKNNHVILSIKLDLNEVPKLKSTIGNVHVIPEDDAEEKSSIHERGREGCTKYFLIPKALRRGIKLKKEVACLKQESDKKVIWAYIMDKI